MTRPLALAAAGAAALSLAGAGALTGLTASDFTATTATPASTFTAAADSTPPTVSAAAVVKVAGGTANAVRPGGTYYVYASATDDQSLGTVKADVTALGGSSATVLTTGTYTVSGVTYGFRSSALTAPGATTAGVKTVTVSATDGASNTASRTATVTVDATAPAGSAVTTVNKTGGTAGHPESGDKVIFTYSEAMEPVSFVTSWTGAATNIQVALVDGGGSANDQLWFYDWGANINNLDTVPLGVLDLGTGVYITSGDYLVFGLNGGGGTPSSMAMSGSAITVTLGTPTATAGYAGTATMRWTPDAGATDLAGNAASTATVTESGTPGKDF